MESPLAYDNKVVKEFGIDKDVEPDHELKIGHVRIQLEEIKKFLWRERVELLLAEAQTKSDVEALAAGARSKVAEHRSNIKGVVASIRVLQRLLDELVHAK